MLNTAHAIARRDALRLSQREIARRIGTPPNAVGSWFKGTSAPNLAHFAKLVRVLRTTPQELIILPPPDEH